MVPRIADAPDAERAVSHLRYGPAGVRGVALLNRAGGYGERGRENVDTFDERVVGVIQIESVSAVAEVDAIAAIDGVDCLFVGPNDLTHALGIFQRTEHELYVNALDAVREAAARHGKATGVLVPGAAEAARYRELGFTLIAVGSDTSYLAAGARAAVAAGRE
jgi:2-dehydro-3-deoxyglucarate aldolase/4-hydroxy-2-oxoheptanedioate aldolase